MTNYTSGELRRARETGMALSALYYRAYNWMRLTINWCRDRGAVSSDSPDPTLQIARDAWNRIAKDADAVHDNSEVADGLNIFRRLHGPKPPLLAGQLVESYHAHAWQIVYRLVLQTPQLQRALEQDRAAIEATIRDAAQPLWDASPFVEEGMRAELLHVCDLDRSGAVSLANEPARKVPWDEFAEGYISIAHARTMLQDLAMRYELRVPSASEFARRLDRTHNPVRHMKRSGKGGRGNRRVLASDVVNHFRYLCGGEADDEGDMSRAAAELRTSIRRLKSHTKVTASPKKGRE